MRLDGLVRLIGAFEFHQLRELAVEYLSLSGYRNPTLTDGWRDGGTDLRVMRADGVPHSMVVQVSVEARWQAKLRSDIDKARKNYAPSTFFYISSRRLPERDFAPMATQCRSDGLELVKVDAQAMASAFFERKQSGRVLAIAGLGDVERPREAPRRLPREEAAYAYLFLSDDSQEFRQRVSEQAVTGHLAENPEGAARPAVVEHVSSLLGLATNQAAQVESVIDRMLTRGQLIKEGERLQLKAADIAERLALRAILDASWADLTGDLVEVVKGRLTTKNQAAVSGQVLLDSVGAALALSSELTASGLDRSITPRSQVFPQLRERVASLMTLLQDWGMSDAADRHATVLELIEVAAGTQPAQALVAAELYTALSGLDGSRLATALGQVVLPPVVLDASVAIPMLLSRLFGAGPSRFFRAADELFRQSEAHQIQLLLPTDYLEEAAAHLLDAWKDYKDLLDVVPELAASTNAYVAHYARLRQDKSVSDFAAFLAGLGMKQSVLEQGTFVERRRIVMRLLAAGFARYGITELQPVRLAQGAFRAAEDELTALLRQSGRTRAPVLQKHDAAVVAHLDTLGSDTPILCSWDRLLLDIQRAPTHIWLAVDPAALADLLALANEDPDKRPVLLSPGSWARELLETEVTAAAVIWDWLAKEERSGFHDGALLVMAHDFVENFQAAALETRRDVLAEAWKDWKASHAAETEAHS